MNTPILHLPPVMALSDADAYRIEVRDWGQSPYPIVYDAMRDFTAQRHRDHDMVDQLWVVEHPSAYTLGQATKAEHLPKTGTLAESIPCYQIDRGGQITYHGPGQLVFYFLLNLNRRSLSVRHLISMLEMGIIEFLKSHDISAYARRDAPGVYVDDAKIAALGLKIRHGCSYHGLSFNVCMDLSPFQWIHPCGYTGLRVTQLSDLTPVADIHTVKKTLITWFLNTLNTDTPIAWRK